MTVMTQGSGTQPVNKVLIAPDSFKGTLSAQQIADIIGDELAERFPDTTIEKLPIADGGEGSVETIIAAVGGHLETATVRGPNGRQIKAHYGVTTDGHAVLEAAQSTGITRQHKLHPMTATTYGFGQLITHALDLGLRTFYLCVGGTASTDAGCGMAAALGAKFHKTGEGKTGGRISRLKSKNAEPPFVPSGGTLRDITHVDLSELDPRIQESTFTVLSDVDNPLYGLQGAAHIYAPQKGASPKQVEDLDKGLRRLAGIYQETLGADWSNTQGAGAAGGLGFGSLAILGANIESGIEDILELCNFKERLKGTDLIITGEGKLDNQSFAGKTLSGVLKHAGQTPVIAICGTNEADKDLLRKHKLEVIEISKVVSLEESLNHPKKSLQKATKKLAGTMFCMLN